MIKNNYKKMYISLAMLLVLGISFVSAFSVSAPYMENKELALSLNSKTINLEFVLQNGGGATEDVNIKVSVLEGSEIITLLDSNETYLVSPGDKVPVNMRITLPVDVIEGDSYDIVLSFATVTTINSGEFGFGTGQEQRFTVIAVNDQVQEEKSGISKTLLYIIIGVLLLLIIIVFVMIKRKKK